MALAVDLQRPALAHVAVSSCGNYTGQFNMFVTWREALAEPRASLPASDATVTLYMQSVMNSAKTFVPVKAASAAIAFIKKTNLFDHEPTQSPATCLVRSVAMRKFGLNAKNRKGPFEWDQVVDLAEAYGDTAPMVLSGGVRINVPKCHTPSRRSNGGSWASTWTLRTASSGYRSIGGRRYARRRKALWERDTEGCKREGLPTLLEWCFLCISHGGQSRNFTPGIYML
jgi:hypothetical protein